MPAGADGLWLDDLEASPWWGETRQATEEVTTQLSRFVRFGPPGGLQVKAAPPVASRRGRRWDEPAVRAALTEFLRGWEVWPTCEEFAVGGAKGLRDAVSRIPGPGWWARGMNLPGGDRPRGGVQRWADDVIRGTLTEFFGRRSDWPSQREFDEAGLRLREALRDHGGPRRWSRELGVSWTPTVAAAGRRASRGKPKRPVPPARQWPKWNERTIAAELELFLAGRRVWPRYAEFIERGRADLYQAVLEHGGTHLWAERMGVEWVERYGGDGPRWTEECVRQRLTSCLQGRTVWPRPEEFAAAGERSLLTAARRLGGVGRWTDAFGFEPFPRSSSQPSPSRRPTRSLRSRRPAQRSQAGRPATPWDETRISAAIAPLVKELERWPTKGEFRGAGLGKALAAVYDHGGSSLWQQRFGVAPRGVIGPVPVRRRWNPELVEAELRVFSRGRMAWPTYAEFEAGGTQGLYHAAARYGGIRHWQERLALTPSAHHQAQARAKSTNGAASSVHDQVRRGRP